MASEKWHQVIVINDLRFCVGPCVRCDQSATESEALRAFTEWKGWFGALPSCAVCGGAIAFREITLAHMVVGASPEVLAWRVHSVEFDHCLSFTAYKGVEV